MAKSFFEEVYRKLFKRQNSNQPVVHEQLKRSEKELEDYGLWKSSEFRENLLQDFDRAYHLKRQQVESAMKVHLLDSQYANGFAITYNNVFTEKNFRNLFDYFKDCVLEQGYKLAQADRRISDKQTHEETIEKWYLKPQGTDFDQEIIDQRYGNVIIEYIAIDRKPSFIRLMANVYQDRLYAQARPFEELFNKFVSN
jgi:hypothetical protein